jgi:hypothetical protein
MARMPTQWSGENYLSKDGAANLAMMLADYWRERGRVVKTHYWIIEHSNRPPVYCVRSDMIGGYPRSLYLEIRERNAAIATGA